MKRLYYLLMLLAVACCITVQAASADSTLPTPVIQYGKATLAIKFKNYDPEVFDRTEVVAFKNLTGELTEVVVDQIGADGTWSQDITVPGTTPCVLYLGRNTSIHFYLETGATTTLTVAVKGTTTADGKQDVKGKLVEVDGPTLPLTILTQELNSGLPDHDLQEWFYVHPNEMGGLDPAAFKARLVAQVDEMMKAVADRNVSKATLQLIELNNRIDLQVLLSQPRLTTIASIRAKKITSAQANDYYKKALEQMPADYFTPAELAVLNTPQALLSPKFRNGVGTLSQQKPEELAAIFKTDKGIFFDAKMAQALNKQLADFTPLTDAQKATLASMPEAVNQALLANNQQLLATIEANKQKTGYHVNEVDAGVTDENLFASITNRYKGKTVLVDFWATWCGPCRMANKEMAPMKEELKDKGIVYVYITGETSPLKTWENMIPDVHGEHYRLTAAQWKYVLGSFKITGIPSYVIVNPQGSITFQTTGFPGVAKMKEELQKALGE